MNLETVPNKKAIVLVDIDDTLSKTTPSYFRDIAVHAIECFRTLADANSRRQGLRYIVESSLQKTNFYRNLPPHADSFDVLSNLKTKYDFKIATRRKPYLQSDTEFWLSKMYPDIFSETFFNVRDKGKLAQELGAIRLIDNDMTHYRSGEKHGIQPIHFAPRQWNRLIRKTTPRRALTWKAIGDFLENEA
jgi:5'(3')-deoxyribonucleotidase